MTSLRKPVLPEGKLEGSHNMATVLPGTTLIVCRFMMLSGKEVRLRGSMGVALVIKTARARVRAERIAVKNFMVRLG
jgi:hypothetical protein